MRSCSDSLYYLERYSEISTWQQILKVSNVLLALSKMEVKCYKIKLKTQKSTLEAQLSVTDNGQPIMNFLAQNLQQIQD